MAQWTAAYMDRLPDSSFAYIAPGGKRDDTGRTKPRSKRHFPIRDKEGKLDADHVRDALSRAPQSPFGKRAMPKLQAAAKELKIGEYAEDKGTNSAAACSVLPEGNPPEWIELLPIGEIPTRDGRGPYKLSDPDAVIKATHALDMSAGIPIDYDHATDFAAPKGGPAPAAGWIVELKAEGGKFLGRVNWTEAGAQAVASKEYRYISPVFNYDKSGNVVRLLRAALTNNPNLYMTAISSRSEAPMAGSTMSADEFKNRMSEVHGLSADASHEDILDAARDRKTAHDKHHKSVDDARACEDAGGPEDPDGDDDAPGENNEEAMVARMIAAGKVVSHDAHAKLVGEVSELKAARTRERAEHLVDDAIRGGRLIPAQRDWGLAYASRDEKSFGEFLSKQPRLNLGADGRLAGALPVSTTNVSSAAQVLTASEIAVCSEMGIDLEAFAAQKNAGGLLIDPTRRSAKTTKAEASK